MVDNLFSFNPCFNGFFSSMQYIQHTSTTVYVVSILVLMDSSLQCCKFCEDVNPSAVSILVLMDSSLQSQSSDLDSFN